MSEAPVSLDVLDRSLLDALQAGCPLVPRPFAALGESLGLDEAEVIARVGRLREAGIIRQIGAIFDTRRLGYQSTLVAWHVPEELLERVASRVSAHPGVSHNYARPHPYNLWFTLAVPPGQEVESEIRRMAEAAGIDDWLNLPVLRMFKLRTHFALDAEGDADGGHQGGHPSSGRAFQAEDIPYVRALQGDLALVPRPFAQAAERLHLDEAMLLERAQVLQAAGIMRRFSAVLRHRRVGYTANGMACWEVPEGRIEAVGQQAAEFAAVSHCYQRPAYPPRWPYNLFTMIHGRSEDAVEDIVAQIAHETGVAAHEVLYSTREFKKERVRYFEV